jgi:CHASE2 domain-containing sensor protein
MHDRILPFLKAGLIGAGAFVVMLIVTNLPFLFLLDLKGLDLLLLIRGSLPLPPEIVIVAVDEPSTILARLSSSGPEHFVSQYARQAPIDLLFTVSMLLL